MTSSQELRARSEQPSAHTYHPLPIVITEAEGAWVTDVEGKRYLDMLAAYSAVNFGHSNPRLIEAAKRQLDRVTLVSRAFDHDQFGPFVRELAALAGQALGLPLNSRPEAVETPVKTAPKWGDAGHGGLPGAGPVSPFAGNCP